jgi:hypothetical protein
MESDLEALLKESTSTTRNEQIPFGRHPRAAGRMVSVMAALPLDAVPTAPSPMLTL